MQEGNLRTPPDESFESTNGEQSETQREGRRLCDFGMQCMGQRCSEPPCHALGLLRSTPPQFAALDTIVAVIIVIIAAAILSLCS